MPRAEAKYRISAEDRTARGLRSAETRLQRFGRFIRTNIGAAITAVGAGITAWGAAVSKAQRNFAELGREAAAINASLEETAALQLGAELLGTDIGELRDLAETIAERINDAADGSSDVADNFARIGLDPETLRGLGVLQQIATVSAAFRAAPAEDARAASSALFGEGRGRVLGQDVVGAFGRAGQLGLLRGLPEQVERATRGVRAEAEFAAVLDRRFSEFFNSEVWIGLNRFATEALARPLNFDGRQRGEFSLGQRVVEAQLRAAEAQERAARSLERAGNTYR